MTQQTMDFDGKTYDPALDNNRLRTQLGKVYSALDKADQFPLNGWLTLREIADNFDAGSEAGISARIRDLRKPRFGAHNIEKRRRHGCNGLWEYRLVK